LAVVVPHAIFDWPNKILVQDGRFLDDLWKNADGLAVSKGITWSRVEAATFVSTCEMASPVRSAIKAELQDFP
jgi:hypothetical protein